MSYEKEGGMVYFTPYLVYIMPYHLYSGTGEEGVIHTTIMQCLSCHIRLKECRTYTTPYLVYVVSYQKERVGCTQPLCCIIFVKRVVQQTQYL